MEKTIRSLQGQEMLEAIYTLNSYSLHPSPPFRNKEEWMGIVSTRKGLTCHALFEDEAPVSVVVSTAMTQNMRGNLYPACGIWGVSTDPAARRKGYCKALMASELSAEHQSGKVFSNLYPFRESFYERLGYVSFPLTKIARFSPQALMPLLKIELDGEITLRPIGEAFETYRDYLAEMRRDRHGMAFFDFGDQSAANRANLWLALARFDGKIEGLMLYRILGDEPTKFNFLAYRFYYQTSRGRGLLLNWIARHVDQADQVELWLSEDEMPETWLADLQIKIESAERAAMSRVLDVEKISGMQVGEGSFSARIIDPICPWNAAIWRFESQAGKLRVSTAGEADCELAIQGLTALVNGTHDPQDLPLRDWGNPDPGLQITLRRMFPRLSPYMHENF